MTERQRLIPGSPAPAVMREQQNHRDNRGRRPSIPNSPKITLSRCKDNPEKDSPYVHINDSMVEVANVGGRNDIRQVHQPSLSRTMGSSPFSTQRPSTNLSVLSVKNLTEVQQTIRQSSNGGSGGLTPPPRVVAVQDGLGHKVVTELVDPGAVMTAEELKAAVRTKSASSSLSRYAPLKPIKKKS